MSATYCEGHLHNVLLGSTVSSWLGFLCSIEEKLFLVGLDDQHIQLGSNQIATVEKAFGDHVTQLSVACVRTIPITYRIATDRVWKSVLLRNINHTNLNQLWLKW